MLVARRRERLEEIATDLRTKHGISVTVMPADLGLPDAPEVLAAELDSQGITVDALVNNAGFTSPSFCRDAPWESFGNFFEVMARSLTRLCHLFIPGMAARGYGRIINVSSIAGFMPTPDSTLYGPVKAYVTIFSETLNIEYAGTGIHVTALCPGYTHTEFHAVAGLTKARASMPKFMWMEADPVARAGFDAVMANKPVCVPGWINKLIVFVMKTFPFLRWRTAQAKPSGKGD